MPQVSAVVDSASPIREPRPKRIKIDKACDLCRSRKVKCDGERPVCGNCSRRLTTRDTCKYSQSRNSTPKRPIVGRSDAEPVQYHGASERAAAHPRSALSSSSTTATIQPVGHSTSRSDGNSASPSVSQRLRDSDSAVPLPVTVNTASPSATDSMTAVVVEGAGTQGYFGSSSAGSFTAQIRRAIDARLGSGEGSSSPGLKPQCPTSSITAAQADDAQKVLPTRRQADNLVGLYWEVVDPLYPFLDKPCWESSYRAIFDGSPLGVDEHLFLATLDVIFAISTQLLESQSSSLRDESSKVYFGRAQGLVPLNTWEPGSIELVQYLLLASQYLQSTDQPHQTWMVVGSAVRIAQSLGLHLSESSDHSNPQERELLRTVWYGCILMDRMVSVTHGRPAMVSSHNATIVPLPSCSTLSPASQGTTHITRTDTCFFVKSVELYEIIHRIVQVLYHGARCKGLGMPNEEQKCANKDSIDLAIVLQLEASLERWEQALPDRLKWALRVSRDPVTHRQAVILSLRFFHAKIILLRPVLAAFCLAECEGPSDSANTLETRTLKQCALICVSTAQGIISVLQEHQRSDGTVGLLPAWWYRVYYVYTAAAVLIAAKLRPEVFPEADLGRSWGQAMSVLKAHEKFGQSARRCGAALRLLSTMMRPDGTAPEPSAEARPRDGDNNHDNVQNLPPTTEGDEITDNLFSVDFGDLDTWGSLNPGFDVANLSWLDDMRGPWELLNRG